MDDEFEIVTVPTGDEDDEAANKIDLIAIVCDDLEDLNLCGPEAFAAVVELSRHPGFGKLLAQIHRVTGYLG